MGKFRIKAEIQKSKDGNMYLHIGQNVLINENRIVGIFDFDQASSSRSSLQYLQQAEKEHVVISVGDEAPRSFIVCSHPYHRQIVYLSQLSPATLLKRIEGGGLEE